MRSGMTEGFPLGQFSNALAPDIVAAERSATFFTMSFFVT